MNKFLLITGASSGIGLSLSHYLSERFHVIVGARSVEKLRQEFRHNPNIACYRMDLSDPDGVEKLIDGIIMEYKYIPYLINNAGVKIKSSIEELRQSEIIQSLYVNAVSPIIIMKKLLPMMKENNYGRIINVTSGAPLNCFPGFGAYSASKGALNAFTVSAARECAMYNIKINLMSPGPVQTQMAPDAPMDPSVCHPTIDYLLELDKNGPSGKFFWLGYEIPLFPNLEGIQWLEGRADERFKKVF